MIGCENAVLVVIDVQGSLAQAMYEREKLFENLVKLISGVRVLDIPVIWTEQNPTKLGPTLPHIAQEMPATLAPIPKMSFSCCGEPAFWESLDAVRRSDVLLAGIEAHICVYQTAVDLIARGMRVHVVTDAVSSRAVHNRDMAVLKMRDAGAALTSVETVLFELLGTAASPHFKAIAKIIR